LALVAAENPVAEQRADFHRDGASVLDGEVGDTAASIKSTGSE